MSSSWLAACDLTLSAWSSRVAEACHRLACMVRLLFVMARSMTRSWVRTWSMPQTESHGPTAYRVYVFNEGGGEGFHREMSPRYFDPEAWEESVRELTAWTRFRVEVRYTFRNKKYRMILRPGDTCTFPPYPEPSAPACRLPKGVLSARLQGTRGTDIDCDVTSRVLKYQGPRGDFHAGLGLSVRLQDMFPFDDQADNTARFTHLRVLDTMARVTDLPYKDNPEMRTAVGSKMF